LWLFIRRFVGYFVSDRGENPPVQCNVVATAAGFDDELQLTFSTMGPARPLGNNLFRRQGNAMEYRDLFISHSSVDEKTAKGLVRDFEKRGLSCWISSRDVPIGSSYQEEIVRAIEHSRAMLLLFSAAANKSEHVLRELEIAAQYKKPIYPLRIDPVEPSGGLKYLLTNKQWVERKALGNRLVDTIEQLIKANAGDSDATAENGRATSPPPEARGPVVKRATTLLGAGLAVFAILTIASWFMFAGRSPSAPSQDNPNALSANKNSSDTKANRDTGMPIATQRSALAQPEAILPAATSASTITVLTSAPENPRAFGAGKAFFKECTTCPIMAVVPAGHSTIGSAADEPGRGPDEGPQQTIDIGEPFAVSRSEVTFEEWFACVAEGGCNAYRPGDYDWGTGTRPVINVSWQDAKAYVAWLTRKTGAPYRLPSEAEWEYSARGCTTACPSLAYWFGNGITPDQANYDWRYSYEGSPKAQALRRTMPADVGIPNPFGLVHVSGNVSEWVEDCWNQSLAGIASNGAARETGDCRARVIRGGSWSDPPSDVRTAKRSWQVVDERRAEIGFRVARSLGR
jgi:formylglycine-generating enzyme required for sulfatase activity